MEMLTDEDFRNLLEALSFEARYEPDSKRLAVSVTLVPEIVQPGESGHSQYLHVPPVGTEQNPRTRSQVLLVPPALHNPNFFYGPAYLLRGSKVVLTERHAKVRREGYLGDHPPVSLRVCTITRPQDLRRH